MHGISDASGIGTDHEAPLDDLILGPLLSDAFASDAPSSDTEDGGFSPSIMEIVHRGLDIIPSQGGTASDTWEVLSESATSLISPHKRPGMPASGSVSSWKSARNGECLGDFAGEFQYSWQLTVCATNPKQVHHKAKAHPCGLWRRKLPHCHVERHVTCFLIAFLPPHAWETIPTHPIRQNSRRIPHIYYLHLQRPLSAYPDATRLFQSSQDQARSAWSRQHPSKPVKELPAKKLVLSHFSGAPGTSTR